MTLSVEQLEQMAAKFADGLRLKLIARQLGVGYATVKRHCARLRAGDTLVPPERRGRPDARNLRAQALPLISRWLEEAPKQSIRKVMRQLHGEGIELSWSTTRRLMMEAHRPLTPRPCQTLSQRHREQRVRYARSMLYSLARGRNRPTRLRQKCGDFGVICPRALLFTDETMVRLAAPRSSDRVWIQRGIKRKRAAVLPVLGEALQDKKHG